MFENISGNPKCDIKTAKIYDQECCSVEQPCGLGQGDCDKDDECSGDLVCGRDNCGVEYKSPTADCCQFRGKTKIDLKLHLCTYKILRYKLI